MARGFFATVLVLSTIDLAGTPVSASSGVWSNPNDIPGLASASTGGFSDIESVACTSTGNCTVGGKYKIGAADHAFVATQTNGTWGSYNEIPGLNAANTGGGAGIESVSCSSAGNCTVGGYYDDGNARHAFVATQTNGTWGSYNQIPGLNAANTNGYAQVSSVSCSSAGNCTVSGYYKVGNWNYRAFVATQTNGVWGNYIDIIGRTTGGWDFAETVSCSSAGNCVVGGYYENGNSYEAFVATQTNGTWGSYGNIPQLVAANTGGSAGVEFVSCSSTGNCTVGGYYYLIGNARQAFVATQTNGTWGNYNQIPGLNAANTGNYAGLNSVTCSSAGNCTVGGYYKIGNYLQAFVATQTNGVWGSYNQIPGLDSANTGNAEVRSVSCVSAGNCTVGGTYMIGNARHAFVATQTNGTWSNYNEIPGLNAANTGGDARVSSVSCTAVDRCLVGGSYRVGVVRHAFVASLAPFVTPIWRVTLDPNGGTCTDSTARTNTWTSVFVGYRYLPNATDCTRPGYTFTGWADTTTPNTPTGLPLLTDPSDGTRRNFIAANADLIAIWTADPEPITDLTVFANFLCGPCTTIWLIHPPAPANTTIDITIDDTPASCSLQGDAFGLTFCQITSLTPGTHTITLTPRNSTITGTPTNTTITLRT